MRVQSVRYFLAVCKEKNFTRAAKRCGVAQPTLTKAIKYLERMLGGMLFHRESDVRLTDLGIVLFPVFVRIDRSAEEAKRKAQAYLVEQAPRNRSELVANMRASRLRGHRGSRYRNRSEEVVLSS